MSELTRGRSGRWLLIALALGLLVALAIAIPTTSATGGVVPEGVEASRDGGVLLLSSGPSGSDVWVKWYKNPTAGMDPETPDAQQTFTFDRCRVTGTSGDDLLSIAGKGGLDQVALVNNGFGVTDKRNCSTSQGEVNLDQMLTFTLGGHFGASFSIDVAEIDVEGKHGADLNWQTDTGGSGWKDLSDSSDNGPDSGPADNDIAYIEYSDGFRSVTLWPDGPSLASVAIEGGGDGVVDAVEGDYRYDLGVNETLFHLQSIETFEGTLACDEVVSEDGDLLDGDAAAKVTVTRQQNKAEDCVGDLIAYNLVIDGDGVTFDPNIGTREDTNFLVQIDWAPHADPFSPPHRKISLSGEVADLVPVAACTGLVEGPAPEDLEQPDADDSIMHPTGVPWCMAGQRQDLQPDGMWKQIQWYHGGIDPQWR